MTQHKDVRIDELEAENAQHLSANKELRAQQKEDYDRADEAKAEIAWLHKEAEELREQLALNGKCEMRQLMEPYRWACKYRRELTEEMAQLREEIKSYKDLAVRLVVVTEERDAARAGVPVDKFLQKKVAELRAECTDMTGQFTATAVKLRKAKTEVTRLNAERMACESVHAGETTCNLLRDERAEVARLREDRDSHQRTAIDAMGRAEKAEHERDELKILLENEEETVCQRAKELVMLKNALKIVEGKLVTFQKLTGKRSMDVHCDKETMERLFGESTEETIARTEQYVTPQIESNSQELSAKRSEWRRKHDDLATRLRAIGKSTMLCAAVQAMPHVGCPVLELLRAEKPPPCPTCVRVQAYVDKQGSNVLVSKRVIWKILGVRGADLFDTPGYTGKDEPRE